MRTWVQRAGLLAILGVVGFGSVSCSSGHSGSGATADEPITDEAVPDRDVDPALAVVEHAFGGCLALDVDVMGGSTVYRPHVAERIVRANGRMHVIGPAVRPDQRAVVVALREGEMFLVELGPAGRKGAAPFNDAAGDMLDAVRGARDGCGPVAATRYAPAR